MRTGERSKKERNRKITKKSGAKTEIVHYEGPFFPRIGWGIIRGINWLLSVAHRCTIVITAEYVNRRVKSEFNIIINSEDVIAEIYAWFQLRFYR